MGSFCRIHSLSGYIVVWSVAILRTAGGGNITWYEPAPIETVTDTAIVSLVKKNLIEGSLNQELTCSFSLTAGLDILTVSMKFDSEPVVNYAHAQSKLSVQSRFLSLLNATWVPNKLTLILFNVTSAVKGEYRCEVISIGDQVENWARTIHVSLVVPPRITEISGETVTEGEDVYLKCMAEGKPTPSITWRRLSDNSVVTMPLVNIRRHDKKDYICTADNGVETPADREVSIDVQYPVEVKGAVRNVSVAKGVAKNVSCPVDGNPEPTIIWYRGHGASRMRISSGKQLTVTGESGCYTCVANNSLGTSVSLTRCLVVVPEGPPWTVIGVVVGVAVFMAIVTIGVVTWWMRKKRKSGKKTKQGELQRLEDDAVDNGERLE